MQVNTINQVSSKGDPRYLNAVNPIYYYSRRYFNKMAVVSAQRFEPISDKLESSIQKVKLRKASGWDINPNNSSKYVLFLHGMAQNVTDYQPLYKEILDKGMGVFALEYRGYGKNKRTVISENKLRRDVKDAFSYLKDEKDIKPENITVMGHSMGGGLAAQFASKEKDINSLVMISPIASLAMVNKKFLLNKRFGLGIPPLVKAFTDAVKPLRWLFELCFNSIRRMKDVEAPTYIIQSKNDSVTMLNGSRKLIKAAKRKGILKDFYIFQQGGHKVDDEKLNAVSSILNKIIGKNI